MRFSFLIGSKPFACTKCPKRFALACNLRAHLKTHQDEDNEMQDGDPDDPEEDSPEDEETLEDEESN